MTFDARILQFGEALRAEGVAIGTSELNDTFAALAEVPWTVPADFRAALASTLAKSPEDRRIFDLVFDRFFFRAAEAAGAAPRGARGRPRTASPAASGSSSTTCASSCCRRSATATRPPCATSRGWRSPPSAAAARARACSASTSSGSGARSGCARSPAGRCRRAIAEQLPLTRDQIRRFEAHLRRELERAQIERTQSLPPRRPLTELDRALPTGPLQDLAAVHRVVAQLKRRLATQGHETRGRKRHAHVDVRRTMRASLQTGGVPVVLKYRPRRPRRPELYVLCDVSTSVTSASVFFLSVLHALHDAFRKMRSFVFVERISEVTDVFERERSFRAASEAISKDAGVADVSGYTDYGRVWNEFLTQVEDDLHPRATVIVLGDARTNGRDPRADVFAKIADRAGRTFWLNPEPRLYWNYGDSVIATYERFCEAHECWTTRQLEDFVKALTRPTWD